MTPLASYRALKKRDFAMSRFAVFGLFSHQKILLARKPVRRRFTVAGLREGHLNISFITDMRHTARSAVDVRVLYRSALSRKILGEERLQLFADPEGEAAPQRLWLKPPNGAMFADVEFSRAGTGPRIALDGALRLHRRSEAPTLDQFDEVIASRDVSAMSRLLVEVETSGDRERGQSLLQRMHYLTHSPDVFRKLRSLKDARDIERYGLLIELPGALDLRGGGDASYVYEGWCHDTVVHPLPIFKHIKAEAVAVFQGMKAVGAGNLVLPAGDKMLGRLLVAALLKKTIPGLRVMVDLDQFSKSPQRFSPWMQYNTGASFLATPGGKKVTSTLAPGAA